MVRIFFHTKQLSVYKQTDQLLILQYSIPLQHRLITTPLRRVTVFGEAGYCRCSKGENEAK